MELVNAIILLLSTALPLVGATITFVAKFIKSAKGKKAAENLLKINAAIEEFIVEAEKVADYTGEQKKRFVLHAARGFALHRGIEFDEEAAGEAIEALIGFSKEVNQKPKQKEAVKNVKTRKKSVASEPKETSEAGTKDNTNIKAEEEGKWITVD